MQTIVLFTKKSAVKLIISMLALTSLVRLASAQTISAADIDKMTDYVIELLPFSRIMESQMNIDEKWPLGDKAKNFSASEISCVRGNLSAKSYRESKLTDVKAYATKEPVRFANDLKLLETGVATLVGSLVMGGVEEQKTGVKFDQAQVFQKAKADQVSAFVSFFYDPQYKGLKDLSGFGSLTGQGSATDAKSQGFGIGVSTASKLIFGALEKCNLPMSKMF